MDYRRCSFAGIDAASFTIRVHFVVDGFFLHNVIFIECDYVMKCLLHPLEFWLPLLHKSIDGFLAVFRGQKKHIFMDGKVDAVFNGGEPAIVQEFF